MRRTVWLVVSCLMVLALVLASCTAATVEEEAAVDEEEAAKEYELDIAGTESLQEAATKTGGPQYGGTLTYVWGAEPGTAPDPYYYESVVNAAIHEELFHGDWTKGGSGTGEWHFMSVYFPQEYHNVGLLAETWEEPDPETLIFHIRKGVRWQDRPPVNGRELIAEDVAYSFSRWYGLGYAGFTEKSPHFSSEQYETITSVEVLDKYTVVFRHSPPNAGFLGDFLGPGTGDQIVAREAVEQEGGYNEYLRLVGTGPWLMYDYVPDSSFTFLKNPDYWGYDELHPENRLPYLDGVKVLIVPDYSTQLAALRAGKIAALGMSWEIAQEVAESHPDIRQASYGVGAASIMMRYGAEPFDDIRVRRALQMSVNLEELAETYYGGYASSVPLPILANPGFYTPMEELPQEVQDAYTYDPERAIELLREAGLPNGFKTNIIITSASNDLALVIQDYFAAINVTMEITTMESGAFYGVLFGGSLEQMVMWYTSFLAVPIGALGWYMPGRVWNPGLIDDAHFNDLVNEALDILDYDDWRAKLREANDYSFAQAWAVTLNPGRAYFGWQPWIGGYHGEQSLGAFRGGDVWARIWIDRELRDSMRD